MSDGDDRGEVVIVGRIQIENEIRWPIDTFGQTPCRVVFDGVLVREPQQGPSVVTDRVADLALGPLRPDADCLDPVRDVLGNVLLHERCSRAQHSQHGEWPPDESGSIQSATASR